MPSYAQVFEHRFPSRDEPVAGMNMPIQRIARIAGLRLEDDGNEHFAALRLRTGRICLLSQSHLHEEERPALSFDSGALRFNTPRELAREVLTSLNIAGLRTSWVAGAAEPEKPSALPRPRRKIGHVPRW